MRKLKVYLDTSVISHLQQEDVPEKMHKRKSSGDSLKKDWMLISSFLI